MTASATIALASVELLRQRARQIRLDKARRGRRRPRIILRYERPLTAARRSA